MSLLITAHLLDKYGPLLTMEDLSSVLKLAAGTLRNRLYNKSLPIPAIKQGSVTVFHAEDVARYVETLREGG
jgi:hypothetical protein